MFLSQFLAYDIKLWKSSVGNAGVCVSLPSSRHLLLHDVSLNNLTTAFLKKSLFSEGNSDHFLITSTLPRTYCSPFNQNSTLGYLLPSYYHLYYNLYLSDLILIWCSEHFILYILPPLLQSLPQAYKANNTEPSRWTISVFCLSSYKRHGNQTTIP